MGPFAAAQSSLQHYQRGTTPALSRPSAQKSAVVPFQRPPPRDDSQEPGLRSGSWGGATPEGASPFSRNSVSGSMTDRLSQESAAGSSSLKRPERHRKRLSRDAPPLPDTCRTQGFQAVPTAGRDETGSLAAAAGKPAQPGLLSRQFSEDVNAPPASVLKQQLENCLQNSPASVECKADSGKEAAALLRELQEEHLAFKAGVVTKAFGLASKALRGQVHSSGRSMLRHAVATAEILADLGAEEAVLAAALLQDVLLRSMLTETQLHEAMPAPVADLVVKLSKMSDICQLHREMADVRALDEAAHTRFSHMLLAMADVQGVLIRLADCLAGLRDVASSHVPPSPLLARTAQEALNVYAPLANRLGVWSLKAAIEDLAFQALHPQEHAELKARLAESHAQGTLESALDQLSGALKQQGVEGADLSGRPKNLYGVSRKMLAKGYGLDQVYDVRALRVIVKSKSDCYAALREVHRLWPAVNGRFKDYIRTPKQNGYRSLHTVVMAADGVPMEVQIRTDKMHMLAEFGVAAHWRYKEEAVSAVRDPDSIANLLQQQQVAWARWLISWELELKDKKARPAGSPPHDTALSELADRICAFPMHAADCKFAAYLHSSCIAPRPVSQDLAAEAPVYVLLVDRTQSGTLRPHDAGMAVRDLPAKTTTGQLASLVHAPSNACILVNEMIVRSESQQLVTGDRVEICLQPQEATLTGADLERQRQRLQKLFGQTPAVDKDTVLG